MQTEQTGSKCREKWVEKCRNRGHTRKYKTLETKAQYSSGTDDTSCWKAVHIALKWS